MRFGIYTEMQTPLDKPHADLTWETMRQIEHADAVGFDTYSVIEHHFFQQFGISANPLAMFTAAAQRTRRIRFRTLCHTLPLHNPLLLAGAIAEADILTTGPTPGSRPYPSCADCSGRRGNSCYGASKGVRIPPCASAACYSYSPY